jgi:hypothetical protein
MAFMQRSTDLNPNESLAVFDMLDVDDSGRYVVQRHLTSFRVAPERVFTRISDYVFC